MNENDIRTTSPECDPENNPDTTLLPELQVTESNDASENIKHEGDSPEPDTAEETPGELHGIDEEPSPAEDTASPKDAVPKRPRARRTRKVDPPEAETEAATKHIGESEEAAAGKAPAIQSDRARQNAARRRDYARKLRMEAPLDAAGRPLVDGDGTFDAELAEVFQKKNNREIVSGCIEDVKAGRNGGEGWVEIPYNGFRVLIPFSELDYPFEARSIDENDERYVARLARTVSNMVGARIEFVITAVESEERIATGSRLMATRARRRYILNGKDRDGSFIIYEGRQVSANVLSVRREVAFLDVYGMRVRLRAQDIRADFVNNVADELETGMTVPVFITHLSRNEDGEVTEMFVTMRDDKAEKRKLQSTAASIKEGDICRGRVSRRTVSMIFMVLNNGLQAYTFVSSGLKANRIPNVGDNVSLRVNRVNENRRNGNPVVHGTILRTINYNAR